MTVMNFQKHAPEVGARVFIAESAVVIGQVKLGDDCSVWPQCSIRGDINRISIGARSNIQDGSIIHVNHDGPYYPGGSQVVIGNDVTVGHKVVLHGCKIGDACLIGMGAILLDDAELDARVMIGAGSLVPMGKRLESGYLWVGTPVKKVRMLTTSEQDFLEYSAAHYVKIKNEYLIKN